VAQAPEAPHVSEALVSELRQQNRELEQRVDALEAELKRLSQQVDELVRDLRG
jgi:cell division protein FtsB